MVCGEAGCDVGDGKHDDTEYLQSLLDRGGAVYFPRPDVNYVISRPLVIGERTSLSVDKFTTIKLKSASDCVMLVNKHCYGGGRDVYISVGGGIWDYNDQEQTPNPIVTGEWNKVKAMHGDQAGYPNGYCNTTQYYPEYLGVAVRFANVDNLSLSDMIVKDPITFAVQIGNARYFDIRHITFDFDLGNPCAINTDGIHIDGNSAYGYICDLKGTTYDDLLAINADDFLTGPIHDIVAEGIFAEGCHSAVRLLSVNSPVTDISISGVTGTYYQYAVTVSKFFDGPNKGVFRNLIFRNICVSKSVRAGELKEYSRTWEVFNIDSDLDIDNLVIENFARYEYVNPIESFNIGKGTHISNMVLRDCVQRNCLGHEGYVTGRGHVGDTNAIPSKNSDNDVITFIVNEGDIDRLELSGCLIEGTRLAGEGRVGRMIVT